MVKISYESQGKKLDLIVYKEDKGYSIRINEFQNNLRKKIKNKESPLPNQKTYLIRPDQTDLMAKIGDVLDHYVGKKRTRIPEKVEEAYKLLQEKEERTEKKPKKHRIVKTIGKIALITALT